MRANRSEFIANRALVASTIPPMQVAAVHRYDRAREIAAAKERIARLAYVCTMLALGVALFYSAT